ncbi:sensor histidine kinase [Daejeonella lutea]|uniref:Histidine kinase n=1 Tax=Daejeonella lutea TaxID=572036 RepID=A0A1T5BMU7_9SPHI|nr:sensor histidine kinase [Daejeonella lutea]SKB48582.1 Histidine kinase [Daejeonella lutea]
MHRIKRVFRNVHIVLWVLFGLLVALQLSQDRPSSEHWLTMTTGIMLTTLYVFYSHFILLKQFSGKKKRRPYFLRLGLIILTGNLPFLLFHHVKFDTFFLFFNYYIISLISMVPVFVFLSWLARVTENLVINTFKKEQLEKQAVEAELYYLKSQINPHFLFNTLNNIHTLVYKQALAAPEAVLQLASLMRYMIYESNSPLVPLSREMTYLQDYMSLQQLKYKNSPVVDLQVEGLTDSCHIAPLLFIHLLENAYKHSPARLEPGEVKVNMKITGDTLTFMVQNPVSTNPGRKVDEPGGIGLPNVRKRLALLYPGKHSLEANNSGGTFTVKLKIQGLKLMAHEKEADLLYHR